jgi:hypothetical protein
MQSIDGNHQVFGDVLAILCAPSCLGAYKIIKHFLFRTAYCSFVLADTLHVVGSCHDPTTCKVSPKTNGWMPTLCPFRALAGACERPKWPNAVFVFPNGFSPVRDVDTLHVVGSYHDPTTCKVSEQNILFWSSRAAPDAMVVLVGIHVIRSGFVREMFFLIS